MIATPRPALGLALALVLATALSACSVEPPYASPSVAVPDHYLETGKAGGTGGATSAQTAAASSSISDAPHWQAAAPADTVPRGAWWSVFHDPDLDALEQRVDVSNQTVVKAVAELDAARALVAYERAGYAPTVTAGASQERFRTSSNVEGHSLAGKTIPDYSVGVGASWEPDLFGKIRSSVDTANANAQASDADLGAVRLAVGAELATDYFDLRETDFDKALLDDTVAAYRDAYEMTQQRLKIGIASASDVADAKAQLDATESKATDAGLTRTRLQHAIATLIGVPASSFVLAPRTASISAAASTGAIAPTRPIVSTGAMASRGEFASTGAITSPGAMTSTDAVSSIGTIEAPDIPVGLPSTLLERRPDIAAAERRVAAANAQIGATRAAFYPDLTLSVTAGLESSAFGPWLTAPSLFWALGPQLAQTLFDGGKRTASLHVADAHYTAAVADYRQTVLTAFEQVENSLASAHALDDEAQSQHRAVEASNEALTLAMNRYKGGAISYLDVVTVQTTALANQRAEIDIARRRLDADVALLEALGGGWRVPEVASSGQ
ncbi:efflux transporter outer membrane subunit [Pararobbsia alpina]|uniref:efflux transporter outer membrane subunit n=1 Tax=Pararobbsia alpina TaxID=621374 RepID=UPI0039A723EC